MIIIHGLNEHRFVALNLNSVFFFICSLKIQYLDYVILDYLRTGVLMIKK